MIFAGDFAQLPPTNHNYLYGDFEKPEMLAKLSKQHSAIGKFLWHHITTVVILTQNMFALENMRYADYLNYRNTSIITSFNGYKDQYNMTGVEHSATDTGQKLVHFKSCDILTSIQKKNRKGKKRKQHSKDSDHDMMTEDLQKSLWKLEPISSDHIPGTLSLCIELCITRGQEAVVVGWDSGIGSYQSMTLETLFVKLINPPKTVNINGLPENVVPIPKNKNKIQCMLPDDFILSKTRQYNIVDLSCSQTFHHMYTSLSRNSNAANTYILCDFDEQKITCGISGYL
ncbi:hypothetical protein FA15DRAFT_683464 [Coprinopsis marcescibilis]|uniref:ATP-dependent DNA helicase n=1 Tax=Coprinopsis marcescibilis TaxID=230819 RepID=A0A5C3KCE5_COPMA|nr:hypothetical protein FA15DRAFT_683464 [Coprinopsis marcescibilis]